MKMSPFYVEGDKKKDWITFSNNQSQYQLPGQKY